MTSQLERENKIKSTRDINVWLSVIEEFVADGELERARRVLEKAFKLHPENILVSLKYAAILERLGRHAAVETVLRRTVDVHPEHVDAWSWLAVRALANGDRETAIAAMRKVVLLDPANQHYRLLAIALDEQGQTREAIEILSHGPADSANMNLCGVLQHKMGRHTDALKSYQKGLEAGGEDSFIYNNCGRLFEDLGDDEEAIHAFDRAVELDKFNAVAWNNVGLLLRRRGFFPEAEKSFRLSISIAPYFGNPWFNLRDLTLAEPSVLERALSDCRLTEPVVSKWTQAGWNVFDENHLSKQLASLLDRAQQFPEDSDCLHKLALCMFSVGRYQESGGLLRRAVMLKPESTVLWNLSGMVAEKLGEIAEAISYYEKALQCDDQYISAIFNVRYARDAEVQGASANINAEDRTC